MGRFLVTPITTVGVRKLITLTTVLVALAAFVGTAAHLLRLPLEAWKETATFIERDVPPGTPILAYVSHSLGLSYYLEQPVTRLEGHGVVDHVCNRSEPVVYVIQPYDIEPVEVSCLKRAGTRHVRFRQHSRGGEINVWVSACSRFSGDAVRRFGGG